MSKSQIINIPKGSTGGSWFFEQQVYFLNSIARCLKGSDGSANIPKIINIHIMDKKTLLEELKNKNFRIRKLTPRECFRLMDVDDDDIDKIQKSVPNESHQYMLAGNSIVVSVLFHIFRKLFIETEIEKSDTPIQLTIF